MQIFLFLMATIDSISPDMCHRESPINRLQVCSRESYVGASIDYVHYSPQCDCSILEGYGNVCCNMARTHR